MHRGRLLAVVLVGACGLAHVEGFASTGIPVLSRAAAPRTSRRAAGAWMQEAQATPQSFVLSKEKFEPSQVELKRAWFQAWGFAEPEPLKDGKGAGMGMGMGMGGSSKAKGKGKKGPPKAASNTKLFCKAPDDDLVTIFRADLGSSTAEHSFEDLASLGEAARGVIEEALPKTGAVLLRGLPMRSAEEFSHFWQGHLSAQPELEEGIYNSLGPSGGRDKMSGIDLATNVPPQFLLLCHNEMCYNPKTIARIALYCVQDAQEGGETILARNSDLNKNLPANARAFLEQHGGIMYEREFYDARNPPQATLAGGGAKGSWQDKCSLPKDAGKADAEAFFKAMGFTSEQMQWDDQGGLKLTNYHPGFVKDPQSGEEVWWNIIHTGSLKAGDGTPFPKKMVQEIQKNGWDHTYAFKLNPGDWLVCDNLRVQHGRLPFSAEGPKRVLLTVYTTPMDSF